jgi:Arc/MetJ family transcription regulator
MKMTMHIDEDVLEEVMREYDIATKTDAVNFALKELSRLEKLRKMGREGWGFSPQELKDAVDPDYDVEALRLAEMPEEYQASKKKNNL